MATLVLFPMYFLKSFAYAGVATVVLCAAAAIVVTPAAIVLAGPRLDAFDVRRLVRRYRAGGPAGATELLVPLDEVRDAAARCRWGWPGWCCWSLLGLPFLGVTWGVADDRVLPASASAHQVGDMMRADFSDNSETALTVVVPDAAGLTPQDFDRYATEASAIEDVSMVSAPTGTFADGRRVGAGHRRGRSAGRRGVPDRRQQRAAVLGGVRTPARPAARARRPRRARCRGHRDRSDQPRQRRFDHRAAAAGARHHRGRSPSCCCSCSPAAWYCRSRRWCSTRCRCRRRSARWCGSSRTAISARSARHRPGRWSSTCRCCCSASRSGCPWTTRSS